jgi:hypothetical protein
MHATPTGVRGLRRRLQVAEYGPSQQHWTDTGQIWEPRPRGPSNSTNQGVPHDIIKQSPRLALLLLSAAPNLYTAIILSPRSRQH